MRRTPAARAALPKFIGATTILLLKVAARSHAVHEIERGIHPGERGVERRGIEHVTADDLDSTRQSSGEILRPTREAAHALSPLIEGADEPTAHIAACAGH